MENNENYYTAFCKLTKKISQRRSHSMEDKNQYFISKLRERTILIKKIELILEYPRYLAF